jgi:hypothetical protein
MDDSGIADARSFQIAADDLDELEVLAIGLRVAVQRKTTSGLSEIAQRLQHIITRTRGYFEE